MSARLLVTGGCGFIGTNVADHFVRQGWTVTVLDNLSRPGSATNARWLQQQHPSIRLVRSDVRWDQAVLDQEAAQVECVIHLAGQVAVTTSVQNPREDFAINAAGTVNVLEAVRAAATHPILIYASTNKVYGALEDVVTNEEATRYRFRDLVSGIPESRPLDFHSPYGCSKGAGDQYVRDYARIYGLPTVVMRQSCTYGPHQWGVSDQGWLAWFMIAAAAGQPVTIYGNGKQTRDVLYITDLLRAYEAAIARIDAARGHVFNIGGGPTFSLSVMELIHYVQARLPRPLRYRFAAWRPGDQACYLSDTSQAAAVLNWRPHVAPAEGLAKLWRWVLAHTADFLTLGLVTPQALAYGADHHSRL